VRRRARRAPALVPPARGAEHRRLDRRCRRARDRAVRTAAAVHHGDPLGSAADAVAGGGAPDVRPAGPQRGLARLRAGRRRNRFPEDPVPRCGCRLSRQRV